MFNAVPKFLQFISTDYMRKITVFLQLLSDENF